MSQGTLFGLLTLLLMLIFGGIWVWAWSSRRRKTYEHAAKMPLEEDEDTSPKGRRPS